MNRTILLLFLSGFSYMGSEKRDAKNEYPEINVERENLRIYKSSRGKKGDGAQYTLTSFR